MRSVTVTADCASKTLMPGRGLTGIQSPFVLSMRNCVSSMRNGTMPPISEPGGEKMLPGCT